MRWRFQPGGTVTVIDWLATTVNEFAGTPLNVIAVAPARWLPRMVTIEPATRAVAAAPSVSAGAGASRDPTATFLPRENPLRTPFVRRGARASAHRAEGPRHQHEDGQL